MTTELSAFEKLLAGLIRAEVRFITVGGLACAMCGFVRTTEDVDIIVDGNPENIERLLAFLRTWGEGHAAELDLKDFTEEEGAIRVIEDFPLDIFVRMSGNKYNNLITYCKYHNIDTIEIPYLSPEGLILLKEKSWRERDKIDVIALRKISAENR